MAKSETSDVWVHYVTNRPIQQITAINYCRLKQIVILYICSFLGIPSWCGYQRYPPPPLPGNRGDLPRGLILYFVTSKVQPWVLGGNFILVNSLDRSRHHNPGHVVQRNQLPGDSTLYFVMSKVQPRVGHRSLATQFSVNPWTSPCYWRGAAGM